METMKILHEVYNNLIKIISLFREVLSKKKYYSSSKSFKNSEIRSKKRAAEKKNIYS